MKKLLVLGSVITMAFLGCSKDKSNTGSLEGQWELRRASGMITLSYAPGEGQTIKFKGNNYEVRNKDGQVIENGVYSVLKDAGVSEATCLVIPQDTYKERIEFSADNSGRKTYLQQSSDSLTFISGCFALDGGSREEYVRK